MHSGTNNLVYITLHGRDDYAQLFDLLFSSLLFHAKSDFEFTLLVNTSSRFIERIEYSKKFNVDVHFWITADRQSVFDAAFARYSLFEFPNLGAYDKILYLDTDIVINGDLNALFRSDISDASLCCLAEGPIASPTEYYGRSLFLESNRYDLLDRPGVTSGAMLFRNSKTIESLFCKVLADGYGDRQRGRTFVCLDQPYLNYHATVANLIDCRLMGEVMENNPARADSRRLLCHFPGGPGNYESKIRKISRFFFGMVRESVQATRWDQAMEVICTPHASAAEVRLLDNLSAESGSGQAGLVIRPSTGGNELFVAIPSFAISPVTRRAPDQCFGTASINRRDGRAQSAQEPSLESLTQTILTKHAEALPVFVEAHRNALSRALFRHYNGTVAHGPFKGFQLVDEASWGGGDRGAMLLGLYEREVLDILSAVSPRRRVFIDLGAADGYYGVGAVASNMFSTSYCFETTEDGRRVIQANAAKNKVVDRVAICGRAEKTFYESIPRHDIDDSLLLVDLEGAEFELVDAGTFRAFSRAVVIIEIHEWITDSATKINNLKEAASATHSVQSVATGPRDLSVFPELKGLGDTNRWLLCSEGRPCLMSWLRFDPKQEADPGARVESSCVSIIPRE